MGHACARSNDCRLRSPCVRVFDRQGAGGSENSQFGDDGVQVGRSKRSVWAAPVVALVVIASVGLARIAERAAGATPVVGNYTGSYVSGPEFIAVGADGGLWFTNNTSSSIGRIAPTRILVRPAQSSGSQPAG
jgi:streptogramin lyase